MKKATFPKLSFLVLFFTCLIYPGLAVKAQENGKESPALPEEINKIVSVSCMPCHSSTGGTLSKGKLNFTEWTAYSLQTQKKKAAKMYKELKKEEMPPKSAREKRPEKTPTKDQIEIIKKWSQSF
jgi:hypothetical protein